MKTNDGVKSRSLLKSTLAVKLASDGKWKGTNTKWSKRLPLPLQIINKRIGTNEERKDKGKPSITTPGCTIQEEPPLSVSEEARRIVLMNSTISSSDGDSSSLDTWGMSKSIDPLRKLEEIRCAVGKKTPTNIQIKKLRRAYNRARREKDNKQGDDPASRSIVTSASTLSSAEKEIAERLSVDVALLAKIKKKKLELSGKDISQVDSEQELEKTLALMKALKSKAEKTTEDLEKSLQILRSKESVLGPPVSSAVLKTLCTPSVAVSTTQSAQPKSANFSVYKMAKWMSQNTSRSRTTT